jgi:ubiquinone/menaquinone biosynthesis C-methylase UbiE
MAPHDTFVAARIPTLPLGPGHGIPREGVHPFHLGALLRGARVYEFAEFYRAKNLLLRYDDRCDYLNYGWWADGTGTVNPSAELVTAVARAANVCAGDVVLNLGSGLGQPDVDIARRFGVGRIVGINVHAGQVAHANRRAQAASLGGVIEHHVGSAERLATLLQGSIPMRVLAIESLAEMPDLDTVLREAFAALAPGGTLALCDVMTVASRSAGAAVWRHFLTRTTAELYGDRWRSIDDYTKALAGAGFTEIRTRLIGGQVYPFTFRHARQQFRQLRQVRCRKAAAVLAYANLRALDLLYASGSIDYAILSARKAAHADG